MATVPQSPPSMKPMQFSASAPLFMTSGDEESFLGEQSLRIKVSLPWSSGHPVYLRRFCHFLKIDFARPCQQIVSANLVIFFILPQNAPKVAISESLTSYLQLRFPDIVKINRSRSCKSIDPGSARAGSFHSDY